MQARDYADLYRTLVAEKSIRPRRRRIRASSSGIRSRRACSRPTSSSSARSTRAPGRKAADPGPWLNRPMRQRWACRRRRSASAQQRTTSPSLLGAQRVVLTRAAKIDGVPTVPSRWLLRLQALVDGHGPDARAGAALARLGAGAQRDRAAGPARARARAAPARGAAAAPAQRDHHRELDRQPLRHLRRAHPGPRAAAAARRASRGRRCAARSCTRRSAGSPSAIPSELPQDVAARADGLSREAVLADYTGNPRIAAFWAPRLARFADWFAETEAGRRAGIDRDACRGRRQAWCWRDRQGRSR